MSSSSSSGSSRTRRTYEEAIHVDGEFGKTLVRRTETADVGYRKLAMVVVMSGTATYEGEQYSGRVKVGADVGSDFLQALMTSGVNFRVYNFYKED